jgi:hypothetical protein
MQYSDADPSLKNEGSDYLSTTEPYVGGKKRNGQHALYTIYRVHARVQ